MDGELRRTKIIELLQTSPEPLSGAALSKKLQVSRQVIVQDIALLRAVHKDILATSKGYIIYAPIQKDVCERTFKVLHSDTDMADELQTIVDHGGRLLNVSVEHPIYGIITAALPIKNRVEIDTFVKKVKQFKTQPLNTLTEGVHFHTVEADSEQILDLVSDALCAKGYLLKE